MSDDESFAVSNPDTQPAHSEVSASLFKAFLERQTKELELKEREIALEE
ncbi:MAG: hypothetical protein NTX50_26690 [Candidatus Sumerlaeota bacterium]|nr:hypothetical protein [Candidatus Sumerlaeota bacterium]